MLDAIKRFSSLSPVAGCLCILLACFALYDALFYSGLRRDARQQIVSEASLCASALNAKISAGLRLGKELTRFAGLHRLLGQTAALLPPGSAVAVLGGDGQTIAFSGSEEPSPQSPQLAFPIADRLGQEQGSTRISLPVAFADDDIFSSMRQCLLVQIGLMGAALVVFWLLGRARFFTEALRLGKSKKALAICAGVMLTLLGAGALHSVQTSLRQSEQAARATAQRIGHILSADLNKLVLVGASLGSAGDMDNYLQKMSLHTPDRSLTLSILDKEGQMQWSSHPRNTPLAEGFSFSLPLAEKSLSVGLTLKAWRTSLRALVFNMGTLLVIALMAMMEACLPLFHRVGAQGERSGACGQDEGPGQGARLGLYARPGQDEGLGQGASLGQDARPGQGASLGQDEGLGQGASLGQDASPRQGAPGCQAARADTSVFLRGLFFVFLLAKDMPISFIPLRMQAFAGAGGMSPVLMGLPVSVEVVTAAASIMLAGFWMRRRGLYSPMICGLFFALLGNLYSMLSPDPWLFILARGMVGVGYGLALLPAQAAAVKEGRLAYFFAGVYGGSLCGGALGAMLADYLGFAPVFGVAAMVMLALMPAFSWLQPDKKAVTQPEQNLAVPASTSAHSFISLFASPAFLSLLLFSMLPIAFMDIGIMNFFLPVFLHEAGVSQADIGRVYMLYCLALIYVGPQVEKIVNARRADHAAVVCSCFFCAAAAAAFLILPPLPAALAGAGCLGLAGCCNIPGQSGSLLRLKAAKSLGVASTMSVLNTLERGGQMAGPLCIGAIVAAAGLAGMALAGCIGAFLAGVGFWLSARLTASEYDKDMTI